MLGNEAAAALDLAMGSILAVFSASLWNLARAIQPKVTATPARGAIKLYGRFGSECKFPEKTLKTFCRFERVVQSSASIFFDFVRAYEAGKKDEAAQVGTGKFQKEYVFATLNLPHAHTLSQELAGKGKGCCSNEYDCRPFAGSTWKHSKSRRQGGHGLVEVRVWMG